VKTELSDRRRATKPTQVASRCGPMRNFEPYQEPSTVPGEAQHAGSLLVRWSANWRNTSDAADTVAGRDDTANWSR
jgi:hypothetical protein